ncbi:unnamed protein product [Meganyctiphanes norvegica]|uniref:Uncharacterized protein n=1 Tax=Meganyctiphanes norvegica TaxID=48144 RepID=A0AAV2Q4K5_MEGNR
MQLLSALLLCHTVATGVSFQCYYCQNYDQDSQWHYDEDCGVDDYQGNIDECHDCNNCYVAIHEGEGNKLRVDRGGTSGHSDGDCTSSTCYCEGELCNSYLCGVCTTTPRPPSTNPTDYTTSSPSSTTDYTSHITSDITSDYTTEQSTTGRHTTGTTTTIASTDITSDPTVETTTYTPTEPSTTIASTTEPTDPTTEPTDPTTEPTDPTTLTPEVTTTTLPPTTTPPSIECFDCQMSEPSWDNYDPSCNLPDYQGNTYKCVNCHSCYTQILEDGSAVRGEAGAFQDGQCVHGTNEELGLEYTDCYCTADFCNSSLCEECDLLFQMEGNQTRDH